LRLSYNKGMTRRVVRKSGQFPRKRLLNAKMVVFKKERLPINKKEENKLGRTTGEVWDPW